MNAIETINQHMIIRETIGYDAIKEVEVYDLPQVMDFLKIVYNYQRMQNLISKENEHIYP